MDETRGTKRRVVDNIIEKRAPRTRGEKKHLLREEH